MSDGRESGRGGWLSRRWPVLTVVAAFVAATAAAAWLSVGRNHGHFVCALDDTYIHTALARNVAERGVWGIDGRGFTPCSSSPLWTLLLAAAEAAGLGGEMAAFALAAAFAVGAIVVASRELERFRMGSWRIATVLGLTAAAAPLPTLAFVANEHALHALVTVVLAFLSARALAAEAPRRADAVLLAVASLLLVATRYEGLFLVAVVAILFAARRRWVLASAVAAGAALAAGGFGLFSVLQGGYFLPNSVLMKAKYPWLDLGGKIVVFLGPSILSEVVKTPALALLVAGAAGLLVTRYRARRRFWDETNVLLAIFIAVSILHLDFARTGEFYRYEAYLVVLGVLVAGIAWAGRGAADSASRAAGTRRSVPLLDGLLAAAVVLPLILRAIGAYREIPIATGNIFRQQIQMALLIRESYDGEAVALNDIGAVNHLANVRCVDLWGLANRDVAAARRARTYGPDAIRAIVRSSGAEIALVYDKWFERFGGLPAEWSRVGQWTIQNNVVCGNPTVSFYATSAGARDRLKSVLRRFSPRLPRDVRQSGAYLEGS